MRSMYQNQTDMPTMQDFMRRGLDPKQYENFIRALTQMRSSGNMNGYNNLLNGNGFQQFAQGGQQLQQRTQLQQQPMQQQMQQPIQAQSGIQQAAQNYQNQLQTRPAPQQNQFQNQNQNGNMQGSLAGLGHQVYQNAGQTQQRRQNLYGDSPMGLGSTNGAANSFIRPPWS